LKGNKNEKNFQLGRSTFGRNCWGVQEKNPFLFSDVGVCVRQRTGIGVGKVMPDWRNNLPHATEEEEFELSIWIQKFTKKKKIVPMADKFYEQIGLEESGSLQVERRETNSMPRKKNSARKF